MAFRVALVGEAGSQLEQLFEAEGCEVSSHQVVVRSGGEPSKALIYVAEHLGLFQRVVVDSPWAARALAEAFRQTGVWPKQPLLAVDELTRDAMELFHWPVMVLPTERLQDTQLALIAQTRENIPESLGDVEELTIVEVGEEPSGVPLPAMQADALVVCAPADAAVLDAAQIQARVVIAAGPTTAHALVHRGITATAVAARPNAETIVEVTLKALEG